MVAILLAIFVQVPPGMGEPPPKPRVVFLTLERCDACTEARARVASILARTDIDVYTEDMEAWNARVPDGLQAYTAPTCFVWADPRKPGRKLVHRAITVDAMRSALFPSEPTKVKRTPLTRKPTATIDRSGPWLSVNGSSPRAVHHVTIRGMPSLVLPNTEDAWRRYVAEDHGYNSAWNMTPAQLAQAHADAHANQTTQRRTTTRRRVFRGR